VDQAPKIMGAAGPFSLSDENTLKDSLIKSRFEDVTIERMDVIFDFDSPEAFTNFEYETAAPIQAILSNQTQIRRKEILRTVTEAASKYADKSSGSVSLSDEAICIVDRSANINVVYDVNSLLPILDCRFSTFVSG